MSAEVTPHHLCLTDEAVRSLDPATTKMNPPLGSAADRAALIDALADGTLDCIATDHAPHRDHEKDAPFEEAPFGVIGLETAFAAIYTHLVEPGLLPLQTVIERMSSGPARRLRAGGADDSPWAGRPTWRCGTWAPRGVVEPPYASRSTQLRLRRADAARRLPPDHLPAAASPTA